MLHEAKKRYAFAVEAGKKAAKLTLDRFQNDNLRVEMKLDRSLVTEADRDAEGLLRELLAANFPSDAIVGEEFGETSGSSGWTWYLDPIDGTQAYARGVPLFGTLIGVTLDGLSHIGVIVLPALNESVHAMKDGGAIWERSSLSSSPEVRKARVSNVSNLDQALLCGTYGKHFLECASLTKRVEVARGWGDCYGYALVATGRADIMIDPVLFPWDAGPMPVIFEEAGGCYSAWDATKNLYSGNGVATNRLLHSAVLEYLQRKM